MADRPKTTLLIRSFAGVDLDAQIYDPQTMSPGTSREQVNLSSADPNMLVTRRGAKVVVFASGG